MIIDVHLKTPYVADDAVDREGIEDEDEREAVRAFVKKFFKYGELLTVRFDTVAGTATVIKPRE